MQKPLNQHTVHQSDTHCQSLQETNHFLPDGLQSYPTDAQLEQSMGPLGANGLLIVRTQASQTSVHKSPGVKAHKRQKKNDQPPKSLSLNFSQNLNPELQQSVGNSSINQGQKIESDIQHEYSKNNVSGSQYQQGSRECKQSKQLSQTKQQVNTKKLLLQLPSEGLLSLNQNQQKGASCSSFLQNQSVLRKENKQNPVMMCSEFGQIDLVGQVAQSKLNKNAIKCANKSGQQEKGSFEQHCQMTRILVKNGRGYLNRQPTNISRSLNKIYAQPLQKCDEEMQQFGCEDADERTAVEFVCSERKMTDLEMKGLMTSTEPQSKLSMSPASQSSRRHILAKRTRISLNDSSVKLVNDQNNHQFISNKRRKFSGNCFGDQVPLDRRISFATMMDDTTTDKNDDSTALIPSEIQNDSKEILLRMFETRIANNNLKQQFNDYSHPDQVSNQQARFSINDSGLDHLDLQVDVPSDA